MNCAEFQSLVAEFRESYLGRLEAVLRPIIETHGCSGIDQSGLVPIPIFDTPLTPEETHELAYVLSDYSRLVNDRLGVCSFFAPSGSVIEISQTLDSENVMLQIHTDGELSEDDQRAAETFISGDLHRELGKAGLRCKCVESGTERLLSTSVSYSEDHPFRPRAKKRGAQKRVTQKKPHSAASETRGHR